MNPVLFSFFSGAGFLDLGFESRGYEVALANEVYPPFAQAYVHARKAMGIPEPRFGMDVASIEESLEPTRQRRLMSQMRELRREGHLVGFVGGPPCPDFSVGGKNRGRHGENGRLSRSYIDLILGARPDFFLFENVKGLWRTARHREFYEELKRDLDESGYVCTERLINSIEYGAPQDRDRIILLGFRKGLHVNVTDVDWLAHTAYEKETTLALPWPTTDEPSASRAKPRSVPLELTVNHWFKTNKVDRHPNQQHAFRPKAGLRRFETVFEGDDSRKSYKRLHRWRYSPTAAYGNNEVHIHPWEPRRISAAEAMAIQSLPPTFVLPSDMTLTAMFKSIGNGVPFLAAQGLADTVSSALSAAR